MDDASLQPLPDLPESVALGYMDPLDPVGFHRVLLCSPQNLFLVDQPLCQAFIAEVTNLHRIDMEALQSEPALFASCIMVPPPETPDVRLVIYKRQRLELVDDGLRPITTASADGTITLYRHRMMSTWSQNSQPRK